MKTTSYKTCIVTQRTLCPNVKSGALNRLAPKKQKKGVAGGIKYGVILTDQLQSGSAR